MAKPTSLTSAQLSVLAHTAAHSRRGRVWIKSGWPTTLATARALSRLGLASYEGITGESRPGCGIFPDIAYKLTVRGREVVLIGRMFAKLCSGASVTTG